MVAKKKGPVFRIRSLPASQPDHELTESLKSAIHANLSDEETSQLCITVDIVPSCYGDEERVALVEFHSDVPEFLSELVRNPLSEWQAEMGDADISFDQHFFEFTQLYAPKLDSSITAEYVAFLSLCQLLT